MIYGIGTDIVLISRIRALQERWGDRGTQRSDDRYGGNPVSEWPPMNARAGRTAD